MKRGPIFLKTCAASEMRALQLGARLAVKKGIRTSRQMRAPFSRKGGHGLLSVFQPFYVHVQFGAPAGASDVPQPGSDQSGGVKQPCFWHQCQNPCQFEPCGSDSSRPSPPPEPLPAVAAILVGVPGDDEAGPVGAGVGTLRGERLLFPPDPDPEEPLQGIDILRRVGDVASRSRDRG